MFIAIVLACSRQSRRCSDLGSACGPSFLQTKSQSKHVLPKECRLDMFGQYVSRIVHSRNTNKLEVLLLEPILYPQVCRRQVSDFAQATPAADPDGGGCICEDPDISRYPNIYTQRLQAKALHRAAADTCKLSLG